MRSIGRRWFALLLLSVLLSACTAQLDIAKDGAGDGRVVSAPSGIDCGAACSASFADGSLVRLSAVPDSGSYLTGWDGCDDKAGVRCDVTVSGHRTVTPSFALDESDDDITVMVDGRGVVVDPVLGFACDASCSLVPNAGAKAELTALAGSGSRFGGWSGACKGSDPDECSVATGAGVTVSARFETSVTPQVSPGPVTLLGCDAPCTPTYRSTVRMVNAAGSYRAVEFLVISPTLRLTGVTLAQGLTGTCIAGSGPNKVIIACADDRIDSEDLMTMTFERVGDDDSYILIDPAFVVRGTAKKPVNGAAMLVRGTL